MKYFRLLSGVDSVRDPDLNLGVILRADPFVNSAKESRMDSELTLQSFEWTQGPPWGRVWSGPWKPKPKNAPFLNEFNAGTNKNTGFPNEFAWNREEPQDGTFQMPAMGSTRKWTLAAQRNENATFLDKSNGENKENTNFLDEFAWNRKERKNGYIFRRNAP